MDRYVPLRRSDIDALMEKPPFNTMACPICGCAHFNARTSVEEEADPQIEQGSVTFPAGIGQRTVGPWMLQMICDQCGNVLFFSVAALLKALGK